MTHEIIILTNARANAELLSTPLLKLGFHVKWTSDEDRAISYIAHKNRHPDLVIIDHNPPTVNGTITLISMRHVNPALKIVIMSKDRTARKFALANGAIDYVKRPSTLSNFLKMIGNHIDIDARALSTEKVDLSAKVPNSKVERTYIESPISAARSRPRSRFHMTTVAIGILFAAISITLVFGFSVQASVPDAEAAVILNIHSKYTVEKENFSLFIDGNLEYSGTTGSGLFVRLAFHYVWDTLEPLILDVLVISDGILTEDSKEITVFPGEIHGVNFYI